MLTGHGVIAFRLKIAVLSCATVALVLASACSRQLLPLAGTPSLSVGDWSGTTSQGMPITFVVSPDETLTAISVGYNFNGCAGYHTVSNLKVANADCLQRSACAGSHAALETERARLLGFRHSSGVKSP